MYLVYSIFIISKVGRIKYMVYRPPVIPNGTCVYISIYFSMQIILFLATASA